mgnify:FL=1
MTSILKVSEIQDPTNGNSALTVDTSGRISTPARPSFGARGYVGAVTGQGYQKTSYYNAIDHNIGSHFDNSTTTGAKFTAPVAGVYHFIHFMGLRGANGNYLGLHISKNGSNYLEGWSSNGVSSNHDSITVAAYMQLAVGDIIRAGWHGDYQGPSTDNVYGGFSGCFIG